jgi:hypothetical protein
VPNFASENGEQTATDNRGSNVPKSNYPLAPSVAAHPPAGEYADAYKSDDSDTEETQSSATLHQLARCAAYEREAVNWQRFWNEYAPRLTGLTELNVRMPRCFDKISSVKLATLLASADGWKITVFADERQHLQTRDDLVSCICADEGVFYHVPEARIWPAGRFVRRTWVSNYMLQHQSDYLEYPTPVH